MAHQRRDALADELFEKIIDAIEVANFYLRDRVGLYEALTEGGPATASKLAESTGAHERCASAWLEQQAVVGILEVEDSEFDGDDGEGFPRGTAGGAAATSSGA